MADEFSWGGPIEGGGYIFIFKMQAVALLNGQPRSLCFSSSPPRQAEEASRGLHEAETLCNYLSSPAPHPGSPRLAARPAHPDSAGSPPSPARRAQAGGGRPGLDPFVCAG